MFNGMFDRGFRRLDFGKGSSGKMEYVFAGALALIIIGSVALAVYGLLDSNDDRNVAKEWKFHCDKCNGDFTIDLTNGPPPGYELLQPGMVIDCQRCPAKKHAWMMNQCLKCHEHYLQEKPRAGVARPPDICPHCKTDQVEYYLKNSN